MKSYVLGTCLLHVFNTKFEHVKTYEVIKD